MHIHLTEKRKFLIVPSFPEGVAKDWRIPLGDQNVEVTTDLVVRKLQSASRGRFSNLNLEWHEAILLPYGSYDNCRISNAILVGGEYSKCNMKCARLVVEGRVTLAECLLHRADIEAGKDAVCALKNCDLDFGVVLSDTAVSQRSLCGSPRQLRRLRIPQRRHRIHPRGVQAEDARRSEVVLARG